VPAGACTLRTCGEDPNLTPWKLARYTALLYLLGFSLIRCGQFRSQDFWPKVEQGNTPWDQLGVFLFCLKNGTLIRPRRQVSLLDCSPHAIPRNRFVQVRSLWRRLYGEAGSGREIPVTTYLTLGPATGFV
jgi:hypothetical protein